jgi:hypothetical protein
MKSSYIFLVVFCFVLFSRAQAASLQDANVAGTWNLSAAGRDGNIETQTLTLQQDVTKLTGTLKGKRGQASVTGTVTGINVNFSAKGTALNGESTLNYKGTVIGDSMKGSLTVMGSTVNWTAQRSGRGNS